MLPFSLSLDHSLMHHCILVPWNAVWKGGEKRKNKKKHKLHLCCYESCLVYDWSLIDYSLLLTLYLLALLLPIIIRVYAIHALRAWKRERKQQITAIQVLKFALCMIVARLKRKENCNLKRVKRRRKVKIFSLSRRQIQQHRTGNCCWLVWI